PALSDRELRLKSDEALFAELVVADWMMDDLWCAVRTQGLVFTTFNISLFGDRLGQVQDYARFNYKWATEGAIKNHLYIAGFQYTTEITAPPARDKPVTR